MLHTRSTWTRGLTFLEPAPAGNTCREPETIPLYARSRFRSRANPRRFVLYSLGARPEGGGVLVRLGSDDHSLMVVREFRRVPLRASSLSLALFTARPGCAAGVVATLAHFVERAVSAWEPAYLMLAQSVEQPRLSVMLAGIDQSTALAAAATTPSLDGLRPDLESMLATEPEIFEHCPADPVAELAALMSPV